MNDWNQPKTVDESITRLMDELPLKYKVYIASLSREELTLIYPSFKSRIGQDYGLYSGNRKLIRSCRAVSGNDDFAADQCMAFIIEALWRQLQKTHTLRLLENKEG
jgi:hypothetical protein